MAARSDVVTMGVRSDVEAPIVEAAEGSAVVEAIVVGDGGDAAAVALEAFSSAVALVRGTEANHVLCCATMGVSVGMAVVGLVMMVEADDACARNFAITAMLFMVSQAFTVAKTSQDHKMATSAKVTPEVGHTDEGRFMMPTQAYVAQVVGFFVISLVAAVYSLVELRVKQEWYGFAGLSLLWVLVATLCLAKSVRDRQDAKTWADSMLESRSRQLQHVLGVCSGTLEYQALVWASFPIAAGVTLGWTWLGFPEEELPIERKGFMTIAIVFNAISCFHMAKLVRDRSSKEKARELSNQIPFQVMVVASFVSSMVTPVLALFIMPLKIEQRFFLSLGCLMTANTALNLAKLVRDNLEAKIIRQGLVERQ